MKEMVSCREFFVSFTLLLFVGISFSVVQAAGSESLQGVSLKSVAIISEDDQGRPLKYPAFLFFDRSMDEIYVVSQGRILVYGADFFPKISLGAGRGIDSPSGIYVARDGRLFVCQGSTAANPPRLTVLNAAFFPLFEVDFAEMPQVEGFVPTKVSVGRDGSIYLVGSSHKGVLVLSSQGEFLRWINPVDKVWGATDDDEEEEDIYNKKNLGQVLAEENGLADIVEEVVVEESLSEGEDSALKLSGRAGNKVRSQGQVQIIDVVIDSEGHIFLLSEETSKVYVYNAAEEFLFSFGKKGGSSGKMSRPRGLAVDEKKKSIYVVDYMRHTVLVYNFAGRFMFEIGGMGVEPLWFHFPTGLALNRQGNLMVADLFNQRVQVIDVQFEPSMSLFGPSPPKEEE